jgi:hypothetical protein
VGIYEVGIYAEKVKVKMDKFNLEQAMRVQKGLDV